jgi:hypothetical protein
MGRFGGALLILGVLGFLASSIYRRHSFLKKFRTARLEPEQLKQMLDAGEPVYIVDLRHPLELVPDPFTLPGAHHVSPTRSPSAAPKFPWTATLCSTAPAPAKPPQPKPP